MSRPTLDTRCDNCTQWSSSDHLPKWGICGRLAIVYKGFNSGIKMTQCSEWCHQFVKKGGSYGIAASEGP
jgi:hypothetical protein